MRGILSLLLRGGSGLLLDAAELYLGQALAASLKRKLVRLLAFYSALAVFAFGAAAFLYVLIYRWLSFRFDGEMAAGIIVGANLLLIGVLFLVRAIASRQPPARPVSSGMGDLLGSLLATAQDPNDKSVRAGLALGRRIGGKIRKAAPEVALVAALLGLVIGVRPEILNLFRRRPAPGKREQ